MDDAQAQYLPWQADVLHRALQLQQQQHLPHAVLIETTSDQDFEWFRALFIDVATL